MGYTLYFNNYERYCRSGAETEELLSRFGLVRRGWTWEWDEPEVGRKNGIARITNSAGKPVHQVIVARDVRSGLAERDAEEYDVYVNGAHAIVKDTDEAEVFLWKHVDPKEGWAAVWDFNDRNAVHLIRVLSKSDGRQVATLVMTRREPVKVKPRKRLILRQPVVVDPDPKPRGGWEEAERISLLPGLAPHPDEVDAEFWRFDLDGNADVSLPDGSKVHIDA